MSTFVPFRLRFFVNLVSGLSDDDEDTDDDDVEEDSDVSDDDVAVVVDVDTLRNDLNEAHDELSVGDEERRSVLQRPAFVFTSGAIPLPLPIHSRRGWRRPRQTVGAVVLVLVLVLAMFDCDVLDDGCDEWVGCWWSSCECVCEDSTVPRVAVVVVDADADADADANAEADDNDVDEDDDD